MKHDYRPHVVLMLGHRLRQHEQGLVFTEMLGQQRYPASEATEI